MRSSAGLVVLGGALVGLQPFWPLRLDSVSWISMGPLVAGVLLLLAGILVGLVRGTALYRAAMGLGVFGIAVFVFGLGARLYARPGPIPSPNLNQIIAFAGMAIVAVAVLVGVLALCRGAHRDVAGAS